MIKVIVKVRDKYQTERLEALGSVFYKSPILNVVGLELEEKYIDELKNDDNIVSWEIEPKGTLMPA